MMKKGTTMIVYIGTTDYGDGERFSRVFATEESAQRWVKESDGYRSYEEAEVEE